MVNYWVSLNCPSCDVYLLAQFNETPLVDHLIGTSPLRFGMNFCYFRCDLSVAFFLVHLPVNFTRAHARTHARTHARMHARITNQYELQILVKPNKQHNFSWTCRTFLERCNTSSKVHSTEIKTIGNKNDCNPHAFLP